jgi:hypothetical protein
MWVSSQPVAPFWHTAAPGRSDRWFQLSLGRRSHRLAWQPWSRSVVVHSTVRQILGTTSSAAPISARRGTIILLPSIGVRSWAGAPAADRHPHRTAQLRHASAAVAPATACRLAAAGEWSITLAGPPRFAERADLGAGMLAALAGAMGQTSAMPRGARDACARDAAARAPGCRRGARHRSAGYQAAAAIAGSSSR